MRAILTFVLLLAVVGVALWAFGAFEGTETEDPPAPVVDDERPDSTGPDIGPRTDGEPTQRPNVQAAIPPAGSRSLIIGTRPLTHTASLVDVLRKLDTVSYQVWFSEGMGESTLPASNGLPALQAAPTGEDLETNDIAAVWLDNVTPDQLGSGFLETLAERVQAGRTGLMIQVYAPYGGDAKAQLPSLLEHAALASLSPVATVAPLAGVPNEAGTRNVTPGLYPKGAPIVLVEGQASHKAVQLAPWDGWNTELWRTAGRSKDGLQTPAVVPVEELAKGAVALLGVDREVGDPWPLLAAHTPGKGRVLWLGVKDLGWDAHRSPITRAPLYGALQSMVAWIAGLRE